MDIYKFKRAVVNLQGFGYKIPDNIRYARPWELSNLLENGELTQYQYEEIKQGYFDYDQSSVGTAVYVVHDSLHYLITARHVLSDSIALDGEIQAATLERDKSHRPYDADRFEEEIERLKRNIVWKRIAIVPTYRSYTYDRSDDYYFGIFSMMLGTGPFDSRMYMMSDEYIDLAVICISDVSSPYEDIVGHLERHGYEPIPFSDLMNSDVPAGAEVAAIGYPAAVSLVGRTSNSRSGETSYLSEPTVTFGTFITSENYNQYSLARVSGGNSGGALIYQDQLAGIVVKTSTLKFNETPSLRGNIQWHYATISTSSDEVIKLIEAYENRRSQNPILQYRKNR